MYSMARSGLSIYGFAKFWYRYYNSSCSISFFWDQPVDYADCYKLFFADLERLEDSKQYENFRLKKNKKT